MASNQLLVLKVCARKVDPARIPPANLLFFGWMFPGSMDYAPIRYALLKSAFNLLVNNYGRSIRSPSSFYGSAVGVGCRPLPGVKRKRSRRPFEDLYPGGPTPGEAGIRAAYRVAKSQFSTGRE